MGGEGGSSKRTFFYHGSKFKIKDKKRFWRRGSGGGGQC